MAPSAHTITPPEPRELHLRAVSVIAGLTALCGVLQLLSMIPFVHSRFDAREDAIGPLWVPIVGHVVSVIVGLLLILLADQLGKRKHAAWRVGVVLFAVGALAHLLKGPHPIALAFCVGMLVALIAYRRSFGAPVDPPSLFRLVRFVPLYLLVVLVFGVVALWTERSRITPELTHRRRARDGVRRPRRARRPVHLPVAVLRGLLPGGAGRARRRRPGRLRGPAVPAAGRPHTCTPRTTGSTPRASCTPTAGTRSPTSRCATTRASSSPRDGEAFLAYTYIGGYALVSGDPIGARESVVARARRVPRDLRGAGLDARRCSPSARPSMPLYESRGFSAFYLGDEAIIDCRRFSLEGARRKSLRSAVRRVGRDPPVPAAWRSRTPRPRWSTSSTRSARAGGARTPSAASRCRCRRTSWGRGPTRSSCCASRCARTGRRRGFLRLVPAYGPSFGYTLDLMRHDPDAPNGMTEFLIASHRRARCATAGSPGCR